MSDTNTTIKLGMPISIRYKEINAKIGRYQKRLRLRIDVDDYENGETLSTNNCTSPRGLADADAIAYLEEVFRKIVDALLILGMNPKSYKDIRSVAKMLKYTMNASPSPKKTCMSSDTIKHKLANRTEASMVFNDHPKLWELWKHSNKKLEISSKNGKLLVTMQPYDEVFAIQAVRNTVKRIHEEKKNDFPWMPIGIMVAKGVATWHDLTDEYMVKKYCSKL